MTDISTGPNLPIVFFADPNNQQIIRKFVNFLEALPKIPKTEETTFEVELISNILNFHKNLLKFPENFDEHCQFNIKHIGRIYIDNISESITLGGAIFKRYVFVFVFRFAFEFNLKNKDFMNQWDDFVKWGENNIEKFDYDSSVQIKYSLRQMSYQIINELIASPLIRNFTSFAEKVGEVNRLKTTWDEELIAKNDQVVDLERRIKNLETKTNFVQLVQGFANLVSQKKSESRWAFLSLISIGILMLVVLACEIFFYLQHDKVSTNMLYLMPAILGIELILLYFFRVVLSSFRGTKTQLLQLDLRVSLCQFIQNYAEYSGKIKKNDPTALDRFEALVFSGLTSDDANIPTVFDGTDQLAKLVKSLRAS